MSRGQPKGQLAIEEFVGFQMLQAFGFAGDRPEVDPGAECDRGLLLVFSAGARICRIGFLSGDCYKNG